MNFLQKVFDNKTKAFLGIGSTLVVASLAYLYKSYVNEGESSSLYDLDSQIEKLKAKIDVQNPSLQDVIDVIQVTYAATKARIMEKSKEFGIKRKNFGKDKRNDKFLEYLKLIFQGLSQIKAIGTQITEQVMQKLSITKQFYGKHREQLAPRMQQIMAKSINEFSQKQLTLEQTRQIINLQIDYLKKHGMDAVLKMCNQIQNSNNGKYRDQASLLLSIYINDQAFENFRQVIQQDDLRNSQIKYQTELRTQLMTFKQIIQYLQNKLNQNLTVKKISKPGQDLMYEMNLTKQQMKRIQVKDPQLYTKLKLAQQQELKR